MNSLIDFPPTFITVIIKRNTETWLTLEIDKFSTVAALKDRICQNSGLSPSQVRLVFSGKLLSNEMSLSFYDIRNGSQIYCVFQSQPIQRQRPEQLLNRLTSLLDELPEADSRRYTDLVSEIRWIIDNPLVQSLSRIDNSVKSVLSNAEVTLKNTRRPSSRRMRTFRAKVQDSFLDQIDASPDGFRILPSLLESDEPEERDPPETTRIRPARKICERPLPNPWSKSDRGVLYSSAVRMSVASPAVSAKARWLKEVALLKGMGFSDEDHILEALCETNGNVQLAAQLLQGRMA
jgi:hypothetical protein